MIVRIRSPQGLDRIEVEEDSRWYQVVSLSRRLSDAFEGASLTSSLPPFTQLRSHHIRYPTKGTALTLRRHGDTNKTDLLSSVENGKTLAEQGVR
jgi:hypothetical protein